MVIKVSVMSVSLIQKECGTLPKIVYILKIPTNKKDKITLKAKEQLFTFSISFY